MTTSATFTRRQAAALLLGSATMLPACDAVAPGDKPTIRLWLDAPVIEVVAGSSYPFTDEFKSGGAAGGMITTPHVLIIDEPGLALRFEDAGSLPSLPTTISHKFRDGEKDPPSWVQSFGVYPLPDYVPLRPALAKARELRDALLAQGFAPVARRWQSRFTAEWHAAPASLDRFEDLEEAFLNSAFYAKSANVFVLTKGRMNVELRMVNGRRKWGSRVDRSDQPTLLVAERARKEAQTMSRDALLAERVYSLEFNVGPTPAWMPVQRAMPRVELERQSAAVKP